MDQRGSSTPVTRPTQTRQLASRFIETIGLGKKTLDVQSIVNAALQQSGRHDFGSRNVIANIERLLAAVEFGKILSTDGRALLRQILVDTLANRAAIVAYDRQHPNVFRNDVKAPLFIIGLPGSGLGLLQTLLAQDPDNRAPIVWEVSSSVPPPSFFSYAKDPRIDTTAEQLAAIKRRTTLVASRLMGSRETQDCAAILAGNGSSEIFNTAFQVAAYRDWLRTADMVQSYQWHKQQLQHLQSASVGPRWVLRSAQHLQHLEALLAVYPDARIIMLHREPADSLYAHLQLAAQLRSRTQPSSHRRFSVAEEIGYWSDALARTNALLTARPEINVAHVDFRVMQSNPQQVLKEIYRQFDIRLTPQACSRIDAFVREHPLSTHTHNAQSAAAAIKELHGPQAIAPLCRDAFADYVKNFGQLIR